MVLARSGSNVLDVDEWTEHQVVAFIFWVSVWEPIDEVLVIFGVLIHLTVGLEGPVEDLGSASDVLWVLASHAGDEVLECLDDVNQAWHPLDIVDYAEERIEGT